MGKWMYTIQNGAKLRNAIDNAETKEDEANIISILRDCYKEVIDSFKTDEDNEGVVYDFEEIYDFLEGDDEIILNEKCEEYGFDSNTDMIDSKLAEFYDICDEHRIFVGI